MAFIGSSSLGRDRLENGLKHQEHTRGRELDSQRQLKEDITHLANAWAEGDEVAASKLIDRVYEPLRRMAHRELVLERSSCSLQVTDLVHELYLRLDKGNHPQWSDRSHFFAVVVRVLRRILVDHARKKKRVKRGGGLIQVDLEWIDTGVAPPSVDLLALDEALSWLEQRDALALRIVELRYFGAFTVNETARILDIGRSTVDRKWRWARVWLKTILESESSAERDSKRHLSS